MSVDDTAQDSTVIDDDLVEALGFEPVTAPTSDGGGPSMNGSNGGGAPTMVSGGAAMWGDAARSNGTAEDLEAVESKAEELLDVHREDISLLADDDLELFDADALLDDDVLDDDVLDDDVLDDDAVLDDRIPVDGDHAASVSVGRWIDEDESIVLLNEDELSEAVEPGRDVDQQPVDLVGRPTGLDLLDPYADYELATPDSVFAESPTSAPRFEPTNVVPVAAAATVAGARVAQRSRKKALRARKSRRVIRHIDPWSVLTFSVLFHMCVFAALLLGSVLVWSAATASGMVENVESFIRELGDYETFKINADVMFRAAVVVAGMLTLASSVLMVLLTVVFNLISDLVGGIRVTVIEEETVRVPVKPKTVKNVVAAPPPNG